MRVVQTIAFATALVAAGVASAWAQDVAPSAEEVVPMAEEAIPEAPIAGIPDAESCAKGLARAEWLVREGHNVDAHLLAQTMSLLCTEGPAWDIVDAVALTHLEEHTRAYSLLESVALDPGTDVSRARILASWVMVKGDLGKPATLEGEDGARVAVFARIHRGHSPGPRAAELSDALRHEVTVGYKRLAGADTKRPWLAGSLSALVPGAGQAYAGSWQGAAVSLVLNGIFISATVELAQNELYFASATTGMAASIFYVGNILNAVDLVRRYNEGVTSKHRVQLENLLIPESRF